MPSDAPEDWTGLTDAQVKEKLAEALGLIELQGHEEDCAQEVYENRGCDCRMGIATAALASYRASLEAAPVLDAEAGEDGWAARKEWGRLDAFGRPVDPFLWVDVLLASGAIISGRHAVNLNWEQRAYRPLAANLSGFDAITAYRLSKEPR